MGCKIAEYDYEAVSYDKNRFYSKLGKHLDNMHKRIVLRFLQSSGKLILDAGVGTGRFALWLAEEGYEVVGVDHSREMLKEAKRKALLLRNESSFILADIGAIPFRMGSFDSCISINVIDHVSKISNFLNEARYVIKPEGFLIFNFSNLQSPYLPIAIIVNLQRQAFFKQGKIRSKWATLKEIDTFLSTSNFKINALQGCMIASQLPFGEKMVNIVRIINSVFEYSNFKIFCGSIFIKAQSSTKPLVSISR